MSKEAIVLAMMMLRNKPDYSYCWVEEYEDGTIKVYGKDDDNEEND